MSTRVCWYIDVVQIEKIGTRKERKKFVVINSGVRDTFSFYYFSEAKNAAFKHLRKNLKQTL